jgi:hypothetical protein
MGYDDGPPSMTTFTSVSRPAAGQKRPRPRAEAATRPRAPTPAGSGGASAAPSALLPRPSSTTSDPSQRGTAPVDLCRPLTLADCGFALGEAAAGRARCAAFAARGGADQGASDLGVHCVSCGRPPAAHVVVDLMGSGASLTAGFGAGEAALPRPSALAAAARRAWILLRDLRALALDGADEALRVGDGDAASDTCPLVEGMRVRSSALRRAIASLRAAAASLAPPARLPPEWRAASEALPRAATAAEAALDLACGVDGGGSPVAGPAAPRGGDDAAEGEGTLPPPRALRAAAAALRAVAAIDGAAMELLVADGTSGGAARIPPPHV